MATSTVCMLRQIAICARAQRLVARDNARTYVRIRELACAFSFSACKIVDISSATIVRVVAMAGMDDDVQVQADEEDFMEGEWTTKLRRENAACLGNSI